MMTAPNVLAIQVRREPGARVPVAVEQQLDLPGFPLMELIGVVYHNGVSFSSGHYTCLCRGPGGRFWSYDDTMPVHREDRDISHIKPKQVVLAVYGRGDGSATLAQQAAEAAEVAVVSIDDAVAVLDGEADALPSSANCRSPRRLRRKTSSVVPAPVQDAPPEPESRTASTPTRVPAAGMTMSPASRRLSRKTSATDASAPAPCSAESPCVSGTKRGSGDMIDTSPVANGASPCSRRLRRKTSVEEAAVPCSPVALMSSPGSRRLRRKTSAEDAVPSATVRVDGCPRPRAASVVVSAEEVRTESLDKAGGDVAARSITSPRPSESWSHGATTASGTGVGNAQVRGQGVTTLRRGRGRGRQAGSGRAGRDGGRRMQDDAAEWFLSAAEVDGGAGVSHEPGDVSASGSAPARRRGVVSGFGAERTDDALGDQAQRDREALSRARVRREDGLRGRARDFQGNDLDRSAGGAWSLGRR